MSHETNRSGPEPDNQSHAHAGVSRADGALLTRDFRPADGDEAGVHKWQRFVEHATAITFDGLPAEFLRADWRFHPREFIGHMRQCGWLSLNELSQCLPKYSYLSQTGDPREPLVSSNPLYTITKNQETTRFSGQCISLNKCFQKYGLLNERLIHFLAQTFIETDRWKSLYEYGRGSPLEAIPMIKYYSAFYGRGIMQLTWAENYEKYGKFRSIADNKLSLYSDPRITTASTHFWCDPTKRNSTGRITGLDPVQRAKTWSPRFDPSIVETDFFSANDSGGFYWVSKNIGKGKKNINRACDIGLSTTEVGRVSILVNGGSFGYFERQVYARYLRQRLADDMPATSSKTIKTPKRIRVTVNFDMPE